MVLRLEVWLYILDCQRPSVDEGALQILSIRGA